MGERYRVKRHDLPEAIRGTCTDANGPVSIAQATARLIRRHRTTKAVSILPVTVLDTGMGDFTLGRWEHRWLEGELDVPGIYDFEIEVTWPGGVRATFPTTGYGELIVEDDLA